MKPNLRNEHKLWRQGYSLVAGVDEVGRGAWAGPLVAAAVLLPRQISAGADWVGQIRDSKTLSPRQREKIFTLLSPRINWAVGVALSREIDKIGLAQSNRLVIERAVKKLKPQADYVLVDYVLGLGKSVAGIPANIIINGDASAFSIALASIMAKVYRDRLMQALDKKYPNYGFAQHKGYGTKIHEQALKKLGPCLAHRLSYRPIKALPAIIKRV